MAPTLTWQGKPQEVDRPRLPFQTVETVNVSRASRERDVGTLFSASSDAPPWRNQLIWGDNRLVMSSLAADYAGKIKLVYIDPPFATGDDFVMRVEVGEQDVVKEPSVLEEHAYRDTWGRGLDSYLTMMYSRLVLIHELLSENGSLYLHVGPNVSHLVRMVCDEVFGTGNFRNEIVWKRFNFHADAKRFGRITDRLLFYTKTDEYEFNVLKTPFSSEYEESKFTHEEDGRRFRLDNLNPPGGRGPVYEFNGVTKAWRFSEDKMLQLDAEGRIYKKSRIPQLKRFLDEQEGQAVHELWSDIAPINPRAAERLGYPTQKPEALLQRLIEASTSKGDLVADFFVGSGTTAAVAEKLNRRWIACDLGRFAIHTTRKRLLNIPDCRPFDVKNLGAYERQRWQQDTGNGAVRGYLDTILAFYRAEPTTGFQHLHGRKADRMVHIGATDAPMTIDEANEVMDELAENGIAACDLLGWEWEMGFHETINELARRRGFEIRPLQIPREVMESQSPEDSIRFFELAHIDLEIHTKSGEARVALRDFAIPNEDLIPSQVRERISSWSDLIDYWAVDFDHRDGVFHNQWQAYRTRAEPVLATESDWHEYPEAGTYAIAVKIIDIFGNDTTKLAEVTVK